MNEKKLQAIIWAVIIGCMIIGGFLGIFLIGKETGEYNSELILPICLGTIGGLLISFIFSKRNQKRNGNVPDVDERTVHILQKYFLFALYIVLFGSGAILLIVYAIGIKYIETSLLILCLLGLYMIIGLGALVAKRI